MLRIYGVHVSEEDARYICAILLANGGPDAVAAADAISLGVTRGRYHTVPLTVRQREAILSVMAVPPPGLEELHRKLIVDQADRVRFAA
jgi:hypothetical protein